MKSQYQPYPIEIDIPASLAFNGFAKVIWISCCPCVSCQARPACFSRKTHQSSEVGTRKNINGLQALVHWRTWQIWNERQRRVFVKLSACWLLLVLSYLLLDLDSGQQNPSGKFWYRAQMSHCLHTDAERMASLGFALQKGFMFATSFWDCYKGNQLPIYQKQTDRLPLPRSKNKTSHTFNTVAASPLAKATNRLHTKKI